MQRIEKTFIDPEFGIVILRKNVKSRAISIRVRGSEGREGGRISVTIPWNMQYQDGIGYLGKRRDWIREALKRQDLHIEEAENVGKAIRNISDGTCIKTLLSEIIFKQTTNPDSSKPRVAVNIKTIAVENPENTGRLWLSTEKHFTIKQVLFPETAPQQILKKILVEILREEAKILLLQKTELFAKQYGFKFRNLTIKHNLSNWGSCSRAGNINLNLNLMRLPEPLCDYVILHELCHLKEPNHGPRFHKLLEALCICNIKHLLDIGSIDAEKYRTRINVSEASTNNLQPIDEILSREISAWRLI